MVKYDKVIVKSDIYSRRLRLQFIYLATISLSLMAPPVLCSFELLLLY